MLYTTLIRNLYIHKYQFTFSIEQNVELPANFIQYLSDGFKKALDDIAKDKNGKYSTIKNTPFNYLYTAMHFPETMIELPDKKNINTPKIKTSHPCYTYLKNYTVQPWWIQPVQPIFKTSLKKNELFAFNFFLCGEFNNIWQIPVWFDVLFKWVANGLGIPGMICKIIQIDEVHPNEENNLLFTNQSNDVFAPMHPISIIDFEILDIQQLQIKLLSPTMLSKYYAGFSFNFVAERILKRALSLQALCCNNTIYWTESKQVGNFQLFKYNTECTDKNAILNKAQYIITQEISVSYSNQYHQSPNIKNNQKSSFPYYGYSGHINYTDNADKFTGLLQQFIPLLKLAEYINIGDRIRYGNGWIKCIL